MSMDGTTGYIIGGKVVPSSITDAQIHDVTPGKVSAGNLGSGIGDARGFLLNTHFNTGHHTTDDLFNNSGINYPHPLGHRSN